MIKIKKNKKFYTIAMVFVVILQVISLVYVFSFEKKGFFTDEGYDYMFANSNNVRWVGKNRSTEFGKWLTSEKVKSYIEVEEDSRFDYSMALYNMEEDYVPPFYSLCIHTISSFFPGRFSWWFAFSINIVFFIMLAVFTYLTIKELTGERFVATITWLMFGFTNGAISMAIFLKGYICITAFVSLLIFIHTKIEKMPESCRAEILLLVLVYIVAFLTNYEMYMFGFCLTAVYGLYLLVKKRVKLAIIYGCAVLIAVAISFIIWPRALDVALIGGENAYGINMPLKWEMNCALILISCNIFGFIIRFPDIVEITYIKWIGLYTIVIAASVYFLFRKESFMVKIKNVVQQLFIRAIKDFTTFLKKNNKLYWIILVSFFMTYIIVTYQCNIYVMGVFADRYYMIFMPMFFFLMHYTVCKIIMYITRRRGMAYLILTLMLLASLISNRTMAKSFYLFDYSENSDKFSQTIDGSDLIVLFDNPGSASIYIPLYRQCSDMYIVQMDKKLDSCNIKSAPTNNKPIYLSVEMSRLRKNGWDKNEEGKVEKDDSINKFYYSLSDLLESYKKQSWCQKCEYISNTYNQKGEVQLWRLR